MRAIIRFLAPLRDANTHLIANGSLVAGLLTVWTSPIPRAVQYGLTGLLVFTYLGMPTTVPVTR